MKSKVLIAGALVAAMMSGCAEGDDAGERKKPRKVTDRQVDAYAALLASDGAEATIEKDSEPDSEADVVLAAIKTASDKVDLAVATCSGFSDVAKLKAKLQEAKVRIKACVDAEATRVQREELMELVTSCFRIKRTKEMVASAGGPAFKLPPRELADFGSVSCRDALEASMNEDAQTAIWVPAGQ